MNTETKGDRMDTTEHMGREAVMAHLRADHPELAERNADEPSAEILRGLHTSDHVYAGEPDHAIDGK